MLRSKRELVGVENDKKNNSLGLPVGVGLPQTRRSDSKTTLGLSQEVRATACGMQSCCASDGSSEAANGDRPKELRLHLGNQMRT